MKIKVILLIVIVIFFSAGDGYGQITEDKFNASVNYFNCKMIEYSIKKSPTEKVADFKNKCDCNSKPSIEKIKSCFNSDLTETIALAEEIDTMKKEPYSEWKTEDAVNFFSSQTFANYPKLNEFVENKNKAQKDNEFNNFRQGVRNELVIQLQLPMPTITPTPGDRVIIEPPDALPMFIFKIAFGVVISVIIVLCFIWRGEIKYWWKENNFKWGKTLDQVSDNSQKSNEEETKTDTRFGSVEYLKKQDKLYQAKIIKLEESVKRHEEKINAIIDQKEEISALKKQINIIEGRLELVPPTPPQTPPWDRSKMKEIYGRDYEQGKRKQEKVFFLPTPNQDGSFDEAHALTFFKEGASIFRLTQRSDGNWDFQLEDIKAGLWHPDNNIEPVCEATNMREEGTTGIRTTTPGTAQLINGKWKLLDKAKIEYVN